MERGTSGDAPFAHPNGDLISLAFLLPQATPSMRCCFRGAGGRRSRRSPAPVRCGPARAEVDLRCSCFNSRAAGAKLAQMLAAGQSKPWQETLHDLSGEDHLDAGAMIQYFQPRMVWLQR